MAYIKSDNHAGRNVGHYRGERICYQNGVISYRSMLAKLKQTCLYPMYIIASARHL